MANLPKFFEGFRSVFGKLNQSQVDGLAFLLTNFDASPAWVEVRHRAYSLATIKRETAQTYQPIEEYGGRTYLSKYYLKPSLRKALGNIRLSDAWVYKGRGYVQITGRTNYRRFGIEDTPLKALEPDTAFEIMTRGMFGGTFTGKKLTEYINTGRTDYINARRVINGLDHAEEIASDTRKFENMLRLAG